MSKGRGGGKTYPRVQRLICEAVTEKSQNAVAKESGVALNSIQNYMKGIGEPSLTTLKKLSDYFKVPVDLLRDEGDTESQRWQLDLDFHENFIKTHKLLLSKYSEKDFFKSKNVGFLTISFFNDYVSFLKFYTSPISLAFPQDDLVEMGKQYESIQKGAMGELTKDLDLPDMFE